MSINSSSSLNRHNGNDMVLTVMNEMERNNGLYDENRGVFTNHHNGNAAMMAKMETNVPTATMMMPSSNTEFELLKTQLFNIIESLPDVNDTISNNPLKLEKLKDLLGNKDLLQELMANPTIVPSFLRDYFGVMSVSNNNSSNSNNHKTANAPTVAVQAAPSETIMMAPPPMVVMPSSPPSVMPGEDFFVKYLQGPLLAIVAFLIVTQTPLLYNLSRVSFLGQYLGSYSLVFSALLIGFIYFLGKLVMDTIGFF